MGWVVDDLVARVRGAHGVFRWNEWDQFLRQLGIIALPANLDCPDTGRDAPRATLLEKFIFYDYRLNPLQIALAIWHEIGHFFLHSGNQEWWRRRPMGQIIVEKRELQADLFALTFPVWPHVSLN